MVQSMWELGKTMEDWDKPLTEELAREFQSRYESLNVLEGLKVSRWGKASGDREGMLLGYCDAISKAYGAMVYHRTVNGRGKINLKLVTAKSRLVPFDKSKIAPQDKQADLTMPRLELWSALMLSEMVSELKSALELPKGYPTRAYSDSRIVLAWLEKDPAYLKSYEGTRTEIFLKSIPKDQWDYVNTTENPADILVAESKQTNWENVSYTGKAQKRSRIRNSSKNHFQLKSLRQQFKSGNPRHRFYWLYLLKV